MQITIDTRLEQFVKDTFNVTDATPIIQKVIEDWYAHTILTSMTKELTAEEILTAIENKRKIK